MTTPNTYRIAAAFQAEKDPQQDAVIAWLGALPKDSRGGVKRSVMKYHLTRALLLYMQSGADTSTALHIGGGATVAAPAPLAPAAPIARQAPAVPPMQAPAAALTPMPVATAPAAEPVQTDGAVPVLTDGAVPVLTDSVRKKPGGLRNKIAKSMQGNGA